MGDYYIDISAHKARGKYRKAIILSLAPLRIYE
jgi:hypothetical protein